MESSHQELIAQFCGITGASASSAQTSLAATNYDLEAAISLFYAASEGQSEQEDEAPTSQQAAPSQAQAPASTSSQPRRPPQNNSKLRTLRDLQASANDEDDEDDKDQDLFAGGEKSGLAVQNPNSGNSAADHFRNILNRARQNPERPPPQAEEQPQRQNNFSGRAQTLGGDDAPSRVIDDPATSRRGQRQVHERITRTLHLWADGISVDDGPLIRFDDPANAHIVAQINQGRAPLSLLDVAPDQEVDLNLEPHKDQNYVQPKQVYKPFGGSGQRLGSPTPGPAPVATTSQPAAVTTSSQSTPSINIDESAPTVTLQIRLGNGSRLSSRFNTSHTIGDVYGFVDQAADQSSQRPYVLVTTFPTRELSDRSQSLSDVGELKRGGTVQQKYL